MGQKTEEELVEAASEVILYVDHVLLGAFPALEARMKRLKKARDESKKALDLDQYTADVADRQM